METIRALSGARLRPLRLLETTSFEKMSSTTSTQIIDIRPGPTEFDILQDIRNGLRPKHGGEKTLPTMLLYDEAGLRLFEKITYLDEYYLTNSEIEVLENFADQIAERVRPGSVVVELGSGNLRKVNILLQAIERLRKEVEYYAVDLSLPELERTFAEIPTSKFSLQFEQFGNLFSLTTILIDYQHVKLKGLYGTYDHALDWLKSPKIKSKPKTILWLGSSLGNFTRSEVPPFLNGFRDALQPGDSMLIGIDSCKDSERVYRAYNDSQGVTRAFTLNGLKNANHILGFEAFKAEEWDAFGEFVEEDGYHRAFVSPVKDVVIDDIELKKGERIRIEESWKFSTEEIQHLWDQTGLTANTVFPTSRGDYGLHLVTKPLFFFPTKPEKYASKNVPSIAEWRELWSAWDSVTQSMVPREDLLSQPIKLRNAVIFYLGHIPTFLDIHLGRATDGKPTEPASYRRIFERGVDPDVENPEHCHDHSEIPETWPPLEEVLRFQTSVRKRTEALYERKTAYNDSRVSRALWLAFEHEAMHLETLLYMLIQSERILPPPGTVRPAFEALALRSNKFTVENEWFTIPESVVEIGLDDPDDGIDAQGYFGWDNEKPRRSLRVKSFKAKGRPITNGEYAEYLSKTGKVSVPASWCEDSDLSNKVAVQKEGVQNGHTNGFDKRTSEVIEGKYVRTVYGLVSLHHALDWPVIASYDELASCAQWMGGRIPTMEETRSIYNFVERSKIQEFERAHGNRIPAVNGHLINNGVSESPPSASLSNGNTGAVSGPNPRDLFIDLEGTNTAFQHWHPVSVAEKGNKLCGQSDLGGAWEWTSTVLEKHDGFSAMPLYPGYTADFFDGKHNIVLGGSWATHSRIAGRKSFVNWYQRNYLYVWATARLVQDE